MKCGISKFEKRLHPKVISEIRSWEKHSELSKLLKKLESIKEPQQFLNHYAEAMIARHLIGRKCVLEYEVPTVKGRYADFRVKRNDNIFLLHVKRMNIDKETEDEMKIHSRLGGLKRIREPVIFAAIFFKCLTDIEMQNFYKKARQFILHPPSHRKMTYRDDSGYLTAECEIKPCPSAKRVQLIVTMSIKHVNEEKRFYKKLSDAYKQFMPNAYNVILITSNWKEDILELEECLLDSPGFWSEKRHPFSHAVGRFDFDTQKDTVDFKMWYRNKKKVPIVVSRVLEDKGEAK